MDVTAQVSLYPLRQTGISPQIERAIAVFSEHGLKVTPGSMSTVISGDHDRMFDALKRAFQEAAAQGKTVMVVTVSNACPTGDD
jgi:uncharacterized protein YqgV (UPF0045/DUF77 family)